MSNIQEEAVAALAEVWSLSPDVRLGQLMAHLGFLGEIHVGKSLGDIENDELIAVLYRHRTELKARLAGSADEVDEPVAATTSVSGSAIQPDHIPGSP